MEETKPACFVTMTLKEHRASNLDDKDKAKYVENYDLLHEKHKDFMRTVDKINDKGAKLSESDAKEMVRIMKLVQKNMSQNLDALKTIEKRLYQPEQVPAIKVRTPSPEPAPVPAPVPAPAPTTTATGARVQQTITTPAPTAIATGARLQQTITPPTPTPAPAPTTTATGARLQQTPVGQGPTPRPNNRQPVFTMQAQLYRASPQMDELARLMGGVTIGNEEEEEEEMDIENMSFPEE